VLESRLYCLEKANPTVKCLPDRVNCYLDDVIRLLEQRFGKHAVVSGIIFGTQVRKRDIKPLSDCDMLIVVKDTVTRKEIKEVQPFLRALEIKHGFGKYKTGLVDATLRVVESTTGMFVSHFICREQDMRRRDFARIFNTNKFVTLVLAPWKIVMGSVGNTGKVFFGADLRHFLRDTRPGPLQMMKSLAMDYAIAIGNIFIYPLRKTNYKYTLEAIKWSINACGYYLFKNGTDLNKLVPAFANLGLAPRFLEQFMQYRNCPVRDPKFAVKAPFIITKLHALALKLKKIAVRVLI